MLVYTSIHNIVNTAQNNSLEMIAGTDLLIQIQDLVESLLLEESLKSLSSVCLLYTSPSPRD